MPRPWPIGWPPPGWPGATGAVGIPLGISIGKTKIVPLAEAAEDYLRSLRILAPYADYLAVNVSSPNTPGLRSLQDADQLGELIKTLVAEAWRLADPGPPVPILVKLAPDLTDAALEQAVRGVHGRRRGRSDRHQHHAEPGRAGARATRPARPSRADCPGRR